MTVIRKFIILHIGYLLIAMCILLLTTDLD